MNTESLYSLCLQLLLGSCLILPPISPAARQTVSSTIKGCAIMKGALTEAIYFPAQRRKVPPVLIFRQSLCVCCTVPLWEGMRRTCTSWTDGMGGGAAAQHRLSVSQPLKINSGSNLFKNQLFFILITLHHNLPQIFLLVLVSHLSLSLSLSARPTSNPLSVISVFILFLWSLLN